MLNKARRKFTIWAMTAMTILVVVIVGAFNLVNSQQTDKRLNDALKEIAEYNSPESSGFIFRGFIPNELLGGESSGTIGESSGNENTEGESSGGNSAETESGGAESAAGETTADNAAETESTDEDLTAVNDDQWREMYLGPRIEDQRGRSSAVVQYASRYSIIALEVDGTMKKIVQDQVLFSEEEAEKFIDKIINLTNDTGYYEGFKYYITGGFENDILVHVLDCSTDINSLKSLLLTSILIGIGGLILAFLFILQMSRIAVEPVRISIEKQKQFITNAGHELKTPLSAIATNMDILSMDLGENEWVDGTRRQVFRLRKLVGNLVSLSKMEEEDNLVEVLTFSISGMAEECISGFEGIAEMNGKEIIKMIEPDLKMTGDASTIHQLLAILCDNAIKYSVDDKVEFKVFSDGKHVCFQSANSWENDMATEELEKLFERFYRGDLSRTHDGANKGYGLGLSIAKAIAEKNHGKLSVSIDENNRIVFKASFRSA